MAKERMTPLARKEQLLCAAIKAAEKYGYNKINRLMIAYECDVTDGLVSRYFGQRHSLRQAVLHAGIQRGNLTILAQGLAIGDAVARAAPKELRKAAAEQVKAWEAA